MILIFAFRSFALSLFPSFSPFPSFCVLLASRVIIIIVIIIVVYTVKRYYVRYDSLETINYLVIIVTDLLITHASQKITRLSRSSARRRSVVQFSADIYDMLLNIL